MKRVIYIISGIVFLMVSCEKPVPKGEFGNPLIKLYGDAFADIGNSLISTDDGYVICGSLTLMDRVENEAGNREIVFGSEHLDMGIIFTDKNGVQKHKLNIGSPGLDDVGRKIVYHNGDYYCVGTATLDRGANFDKDVMVARVSQSGTLVDTWYFGGAFDQEGYDIILNNSNSGFVICGSSVTNIEGNLEMKLWEVSFTGDLFRQARSYDFEGDDAISRIVSKNGNGYRIIGTTYQLPGSGTAEIKNLFIANTNNELVGNDFEIYTFGSNVDPTDLSYLGDGGFLVSGTSEQAGDSRGFLLKLEPPITSLATTDYTINISDDFGSYRSILALSDGESYVIGGSIDKSQGNLSSAENLFLFLDSDLNNLQSPYITGGIGRQVINDVFEENDGKLVATGSNGDDIRSLMTLIKFDPWE